MQNIELRVAALETNAIDGGLKIIIVLDGESQADALVRIGPSPDTLRVVCVTPVDARL